MSDNVYVDVGNSVVKIGSFEANAWTVQRLGHAEFHHWVDDGHFFGQKVHLCSVVAEMSDFLVDRLGNALRLYDVDRVPDLLLDYETPETLGMDRFWACYGAWFMAKSAVLVVDLGSAITIDMMDEKGIFRGGIIAPGLRAMISGMRSKAPALPEVELVLPSAFPGKSTHACIQWGTLGLFRAALLEWFRQFEQELGSMEVFVTGGEAKHLARSLTDRNVKENPSLVFEGMRVWNL